MLKPRKKDLQPKPLYNPLKRDFSIVWLDDENKPHTLTIKSWEIAYFPPYQTMYMANAIADELMNNLKSRTNAIDDRKEIMSKILNVEI